MEILKDNSRGILKLGFDQGNGLYFNGSLSNKVTLPTGTNNLVIPPNGELSVSYIINTTVVANKRLLYVGNSARTVRFIDVVCLTVSSVTYLFLYVQNNPYRGIRIINPTISAPTHFVFSLKSGTNGGAVYKNGILQSSEYITGSAGTATASTKACIGSDDIGIDYYTGTIFDMKVFNKELTEAEALSLYNTQNTIIPVSAMSSCVLDHRFDDKQGTTSTDKSVNGYNGTLINYTGRTSLDANNYWRDKNNNPIVAI